MIQKDQKLEVDNIELENVEVENELVENNNELVETEEFRLDSIKDIALSPVESISELKFPTEHSAGEMDSLEQCSRQISNAEKSLNNASNTAMKMGLKGLVALNKVQQQLEQVNATRAVRLNTMNQQSQQSEQNDQYLNILSIFSFAGVSRMKKEFSRLYGKYTKLFKNQSSEGSYENITENISEDISENTSKNTGVGNFKKLLKKLFHQVKQSQTDS